MSYVAQRYCKAGKQENNDGTKFFMDMLYIDGNLKNSSFI